eukprot:TRINITY_DN41114_c0_g1_i1.p1 TRINITY_DN41114_c0_g1~~TRINITY_DN41114_c0_g1_i1.p1  ORF type:complete len:241 (+),score=28.16 TRINITY_DN41114_c0_g1_i1:319-1041(+)
MTMSASNVEPESQVEASLPTETYVTVTLVDVAGVALEIPDLEASCTIHELQRRLEVSEWKDGKCVQITLLHHGQVLRGGVRLRDLATSSPLEFQLTCQSPDRAHIKALLEGTDEDEHLHFCRSLRNACLSTQALSTDFMNSPNRHVRVAAAQSFLFGDVQRSRRIAARVLVVDSFHDDVRGVVLQLLQDPNPVVRGLLVSTLGSLGVARRFAAELQALLSDEDPLVQKKVAGALVAMRNR